MALRKLYIIYVCIFLSQISLSQSKKYPISANYIRLGTYSNTNLDAFSFTANQATLAQGKNFEAGVFGEKRFLLTELNFYNAAIVVPTKQGNFGIEGNYFGFSSYNESEIGLAYGRMLGDKVDVGIKFNYYAMRTAGYGNAGTVNFEGGAIIHLSSKLNAGLHFYNPVGGKLSGKIDEKLSSQYTFGLGYEVSEKFFLSGEVFKEENIPVNMLAGFQYNLDKQFFVRAGLASENGNSYAGAGIRWKNFRLDVSAGYHQQLGFTPGLMLIIQPKTTKQ
ncbi:MAG: hypothetical protein ABIR81_08950 [Ginsengibacter sp.]